MNQPLTFTLAGRLISKSADARTVYRKALITIGQEYLVDQALSVAKKLEAAGQ